MKLFMKLIWLEVRRYYPSPGLLKWDIKEWKRKPTVPLSGLTTCSHVYGFQEHKTHCISRLGVICNRLEAIRKEGPISRSHATPVLPWYSEMSSCLHYTGAFWFDWVHICWASALCTFSLSKFNRGNTYSFWSHKWVLWGKYQLCPLFLAGSQEYLGWIFWKHGQSLGNT